MRASRLDVDRKNINERYGVAELAPGETFENVTRTEDGYTAKVGITRIHMEEDASKMIHVGAPGAPHRGATHSLVDYKPRRYAMPPEP